VHEIKLLAQPIPPIELQRAKNITKSNILMALERQKDRLEESVKNVRNHFALGILKIFLD